MGKDLIGTGILNWRRHERISDRYGMVCLYKRFGSEDTIELKKFTGYGKLIAKIVETRDSKHIGDLFHGFFPQKPNVNDIVQLGEGDVFYDEDEIGEIVGLKPKDNRETFWLSPQELYKCHDQTVELYFERM